MGSYSLSEKPKRKNSLKNLSKIISDSGIILSRSSSSSIIMSKKNVKVYQGNSCSSIPLYTHNNDLEVTQHYILRTAFGGDYSNLTIPLSHKRKQKLIALDVGCGYGTWTMEMATQFPNAHFIGIDKVANFPNEIKPKNCHFKLYNINQKTVQLPFLDHSIDYIFQRDLNWDLPESAWLQLVQEYYRILKPGGWIEIVEPDLETHSSSSHENILINKLITAFYRRNQDPYISKRLSSLMAMTGFRRIQSDFQSIPLGWGYQKSQQTRKKGSVCSEFARAAACHRLDLWKSLQPWFMRENYFSKSKYETIVNQLQNEWYHHKSYVNWHRSTAQKPY